MPASWLQSIHLFFDAVYIILNLFDGLHGAFAVSGFPEVHGFSCFLIHQLDGTQVEAAVDDVEGVGVDDAEAGVNGYVVEIHRPPAVVEGAGDAFEGDQHVEAGA